MSPFLRTPSDDLTDGSGPSSSNSTLHESSTGYDGPEPIALVGMGMLEFVIWRGHLTSNPS